MPADARVPRKVISRQNVLHHVPMHVGQPVVPTLKLVREPLVIDPELVQNRRLQIMHVYAVLRRVEPEVVGGAVSESRLHASSRHPQRERIRMMIATPL